MLARVLTVAIALLLLVSLAARYRRGRISLRAAMFWAAPWVVVTIVMLSPPLADAVALYLGLEDTTGVDLLAYLGIGAAFYLLYRIFLRLDRLERALTRLVRHQGIRDAGGSGEPQDQSRTPNSRRA